MRDKNSFIIEHPEFDESLSEVHVRWLPEQQQPNRNDPLHLRKKGIRLLAAGFKAAIRQKNGFQKLEVGLCSR